MGKEVSNVKVKEIGNLTKDPAYSEKGETKYCQFTIAINDIYDKDKTEFVNVTAFGKKAEACRDYLQKGTQVCVEGQVKPYAYISQTDGKACASMQITAEEVQFLNKTRHREQTQERQPEQSEMQEPEAEQKMSIAERKETFTAQAKAQGNDQIPGKEAIKETR
jgi:single-strand DNA-binding protein